ncbi:MAG: alpha-amylase [Sulfuritalea sp.]|nr:alpha-amylase [Sulfuritalea sp.]
MSKGPRIYNLFPLLCGSVRQWEEHLPRIAAMGFNWVYLNPFHFPGFSGSLYAVKDYYRIHDLMWDGEHSLEDLLKAFCWKAGEHGLSVIMDLVVNHTSKDALLTEQHPEWFLRESDGSLRSPRAVDPADTRNVTIWGDLAEIDYHDHSHRAGLVSYFGDMIGHFIDCGIRGFRCDAAYLVPAEIWSMLTSFARFKRHDATFFAETLGCRLDQVTALRSAGFDYMFNSARWWDFRSPWLLEQYNSFRHIAPSIAFPESHDTERVATDLQRGGLGDPALIERAYKMRYLFAAVFSTGVMIPVGFEYGFRTKLDVVQHAPGALGAAAVRYLWLHRRRQPHAGGHSGAQRGRRATPGAHRRSRSGLPAASSVGRAVVGAVGPEYRSASWAPGAHAGSRRRRGHGAGSHPGWQGRNHHGR